MTETAMSKRVMFENDGRRLVGDLFLPEGHAGRRLPGLVVTGAWTTVKEQMPGRYAAEMARRGFAALAFDFRNWGQSEGSQRQLEHPANKTADIVAAASHLATRPEIDPGRIGGLGICVSAGYMAGAVAASPALRSLALIAPWLHDAAIVREVYGGADGVEKLIAAGRAAQSAFEATGEPAMALAASATDEKAIMFNAPYYTERDRGLIPEWENRFNLASWEPFLTFDGIAIAPRLEDRPVVMVHSEAAAIPHGAHDFYAALPGPKSEFWLDNVTQFDFYDRDEPVGRASDAAADHFRKTLK